MYKMSFDLVENFLIVSNLYDNLRKIRLLNICDQKKAVFWTKYKHIQCEGVNVYYVSHTTLVGNLPLS